MEVIRTKQDLRASIQRLRALGNSIALVPTMGALHAGHIALVEQGKQKADKVITTVFVNPTQFGANEDFSHYPRTETEDLAKLEAAGTAIAYLPEVAEMYLPDATTFVQVRGVSEALCGAARRGHFDGVTTIVTKLFMQTLPDYAIFGEKDYQQLHIIRKMVTDLDIPVTVLGAAIVREASGLAMSSRNRYLTNAQREIAANLYRILSEASQYIKAGQEIKTVLDQAARDLISKGFEHIDYIELRDSETFAEISRLHHPARLLAAVRIGNTRLIDNVAV